jgi:hypothetical protein
VQPDPLRAERSAFLDASVAASNAVQDLARLAFDQPESREEASALLHAVRLLADKQTDVLTALDRFLMRSNEVGIDQDTAADLRRGRVDLAEFLGIALQEVERAERLLKALTDGVAGGSLPP